MARELWPEVPVVWGGPHVTALQLCIGSDHAYGSFVDGFVYGYAEKTFVQMLEACSVGARWPAEVGVAGSRAAGRAKAIDGAVPRFDGLELYGLPRLTLPVQTGRGCFYGRCTYCTYPMIEGIPRHQPFAALDAVVDLAVELGAVVSPKDSLVLPGRLLDVADRIAGRIEWSACTKLHRSFDGEFFSRLVLGGCRTLELGVETLSPSAQRMVQKKQPLELFEQVLGAAAEAGLPLVINYITEFPGEDPRAELLLFDHVRLMLDARVPRIHARVEHNRFQLERLSPMGRDPGAFAIRVLATWPWASVMAWEATSRSAGRPCGAAGDTPRPVERISQTTSSDGVPGAVTLSEHVSEAPVGSGGPVRRPTWRRTGSSGAYSFCGLPPRSRSALRAVSRTISRPRSSTWASTQRRSATSRMW